jgi:thymidylate kinase
VELAGLAGAGKSTLLMALAERSRAVRAGPDVWSLPMPLLVWQAMRLSPWLGGLAAGRGWRRWEEMGHMVRLAAIQRLLESRSAGRGAMALHEGPVFLLARLCAIGHESLGEPWLEPWWRGAFARCARQVDAIVWLDARDSVLMERIRARAQAHPVKEFSDEAMGQFLARYRRAYDYVLSRLAAEGGPKVIRVDTEHEPPGPLSRRVLAALGEALEEEIGP